MKNYSRLFSAAVVIGTLRVKCPEDISAPDEMVLAPVICNPRYPRAWAVPGVVELQNLDFIVGLSKQRIHMKYQVLFSMKNNENIFKIVVCCSRDCRLNG